MKRLASLLISMLILVVATSACSEKKADEESKEPEAKKDEKAPEPAQPVLAEVKEVEPNEKTGQAMEIKEACIVLAGLEAAAGPKKSASDWYKITPATRQVVSVEVSGIEGEDLNLSFLDADRNKLFWVDSGSAGAGERIPNLTVDRGVYLRVRGAAGGKGGDYKLTLKFTEPAEGSEVEFNGRYSTANELAVGSQVKGFLGHQRDEDWYLVPLKDLPTGSVLRFDLTAVEGVRFVLEILDMEERSPILKTSGTLGEGLVVRNMGVPESAESVYAVVKSGWIARPKPQKAIRTSNPEISYSLSVSSETGGDDLERESNDSAKDAFTVMDGQKVRGYLSSPDDVDWYKIEVERPSLLSAELSELDRVDLQIYVVDPEKKEQSKDFDLLRINDGEVNEPEVLTNCALKPGENYVRVEGAWKKVDGKWVRDFFNLDETYSLTLNLRTDEGKEEREPNRKPEWATPINPGDTMRGTLHPRGDVDMYKLDLSEMDGPRNTVIECTGIPKLDIAIVLLSSEKDADGKLKPVQSSATGSGEAKEQIEKELMPGEYHIVVRGSPRTESNTRDQYLLTVTQP